jgi:hypothetical protein
VIGNLEEGKRPPLEADTKQQLMKNATDLKDVVCRTAICEVRRTAGA